VGPDLGAAVPAGVGGQGLWAGDERGGRGHYDAVLGESVWIFRRISADRQRYASRSKPELLNSTIWSLTNYDEADRVQEEWDALAKRAKKVHDRLPKDTRAAFFQQVYMLCEMQANIQRLYIAGESARGGHLAT
jgi:hypothetical protein